MISNLNTFKTAEQAITMYFYMLNEESKNVAEVAEDKETRHELFSLFQRVYPFPLEELPIHRRAKLLRGISRSRWNYVTKRIMNQKSQVEILDAGCGWGIYSTFFFLLGAKTIGVDLFDHRIKVADKRKEYYIRNYDAGGELLFLNKNLFSLDYKNKFDVIWITEAISHISPADKFLKKAYEMLKPAGEIIIADPNGFHIPTQIKLLKKRGLRLYGMMKDPESQEDIEYADERVFSLLRITKMLRKTGFDVVFRYGSIGFHQKANDCVYSKIVFPLEKMPVISDIFASSYVIASKKPAA